MVRWFHGVMVFLVFFPTFFFIFFHFQRKFNEKIIEKYNDAGECVECPNINIGKKCKIPKTNASFSLILFLIFPSISSLHFIHPFCPLKTYFSPSYLQKMEGNIEGIEEDICNLNDASPFMSSECRETLYSIWRRKGR
jgi:hypothetical protein